MSSLIFQILFLVLLIFANGIFSGSETAIISARKVRLEQLSKRGNLRAKLALKLANSPSNFLSTVQIAITLIGILTGTVGAGTIALPLGVFLESVPYLHNYSEPISIGIVVSILTYLSLVVGELVPKKVALNNPEQIACTVAAPMRQLSRIASPVVHLLSFSTDSFVKLLGIRASEEPPITEEEIKVLLEQGTQAGMFEEAEQEMVSRVFRLADRPIKTLMTPRRSIAWLDIEAPLEENQTEIVESSYSRFPVGEGSLDECVGILRVKDFLTAHLSGQNISIRDILQTPLFVAESTRVLNVLDLFKQTGTHIALVTDEYGGIEGLVTLNDIIEAIVGNLPDDREISEPQIIQREDGSWLLDGLLSIDDLKTIVNRESLPNEEDGYYQTLGGFVMAYLGRIPISGEHFEVDNLRFEVMDMDGVRVDKVLVELMPVEEDKSDDGDRDRDRDDDDE
ncbi:MAG: hemolysin family protein [Xenococcaceae cyanobacterium]